jgi:hypothetical protein
MKKSQLKKIIRDVIKEQGGPPLNNSHVNLYFQSCGCQGTNQLGIDECSNPNFPLYPGNLYLMGPSANPSQGFTCNGQMCTDTGPGSDPNNPNPAGTGDIGQTFEFVFSGTLGVIVTYTLINIYGPSNFSTLRDSTSAICPGNVVNGCTDSSALNYDPNANVDDGSCIYPIPGCTDPNACNFNPNANQDDGSCEVPGYCEKCDLAAVQAAQPPFVIPDPACYGCTDSNAENYNPTAVIDSGNCWGCLDPTALNYVPSAVADCTANVGSTWDNSCCNYQAIPGCMDSLALNYNPNATVDDGSCEYKDDTSPADPPDPIEFPDDTGLLDPADPLPNKPTTSPNLLDCDKFYAMSQQQQDGCCMKCQDPNITPNHQCYLFCHCCSKLRERFQKLANI